MSRRFVILIDDRSGRFSKGEEGIEVKNGMPHKYERCLDLGMTPPFELFGRVMCARRVYYFYRGETKEVVHRSSRYDSILDGSDVIGGGWN